MKMNIFLQLARCLNTRLQIIPLLYGSLGLEQRLAEDVKADDIDILIPESFLREKWPCITQIMEENGFTLYDLHEHAFEKQGLSVAFASLESLQPFAGIDISRIPVVEKALCRYRLLTLQDYLKVYTASSRDGYRKHSKNKNDQEKIDRIQKALKNA